jgi:hypothetical protein
MTKEATTTRTTRRPHDLDARWRRPFRRHRAQRPAPGHPTPGRPTPPAAVYPRPTRRTLRRVAWGVAIIAVLLVAAAPPAAAAGPPSLNGVISNLTNWIVGILAGVATLFLTIGGLRYLTAGGDPGQVEKAKVALKSAAVGYALAILAPLLVSIVTSVVS